MGRSQESQKQHGKRDPKVVHGEMVWKGIGQIKDRLFRSIQEWAGRCAFGTFSHAVLPLPHLPPRRIESIFGYVQLPEVGSLGVTRGRVFRQLFWAARHFIPGQWSCMDQ